MRGRRPIPKIETKKPAAELRPARVNQTRLDDVILPVFCPTSQTLCSRFEFDMKKPAADCPARAELNSFR
jgi:hypothetical protein